MAKAAKRKTATGSGPAKTASSRSRAATDPVDAMLALVAADGWRKVTLTAVAEASGLRLADLYGQYQSKNDLLSAYARRVDAAMLAALGPAPQSDSSETARDRLFEAIMARLDALAPHKDAVRVLARDLPCDPPALLCFLYGGLRRGIDWTLAAAGLDAAGLAGILRRKLVGAVYLDVLRVWLRDDSPDLGATMAHLDRRLQQAMRGLQATGPFSHMRKKAAA